MLSYPKVSALLSLLAFAAIGSKALTTPLVERALIPGIDVSGYQPSVNWASVASSGVKFVFIKATEGTTFKSSSFSSQYVGATNAGLIRGAYHYAHPDSSSGAAQANFFLANGGGWTADGITLPGVLDIEYGASSTCWGLTAASMVAWIKDFSNTYHASTGRYPIIYTTTDWWITCTGNNSGFGATNPLWVAHYASSIGAVPAGWSYATFWQYADSGPNPGDQDQFNGDLAGLQRMARGS